jgi:hypothetical protein
MIGWLLLQIGDQFGFGWHFLTQGMEKAEKKYPALSSEVLCEKSIYNPI